MSIYKYGGEVEIFRKILNDLKLEFMNEILWIEKKITNGVCFTICSKNPINFYFIGEEYCRRIILHMIENHSYTIPEDD